MVAELGWIAMGLVDLAMVGRLGPAAIGAVGIGSVLCLAVVVFGIGMLLGLDTLVSRAYGRGRLDECRRWLVQGAWLAVLQAVPLMLVGGGVAASLGRWGLAPAVERLTVPYFSIVLLSVLPLLLYTACRRYLQATGPHATQVTVALITANAINAAANWLLVFGNLGLPALGVDGAALGDLHIPGVPGVVSRRGDPPFTLAAPPARGRPSAWSDAACAAWSRSAGPRRRR